MKNITLQVSFREFQILTSCLDIVYKGNRGSRNEKRHKEAEEVGDLLQDMLTGSKDAGDSKKGKPTLRNINEALEAAGSCLRLGIWHGNRGLYWYVADGVSTEKFVPLDAHINRNHPHCKIGSLSVAAWVVEAMAIEREVFGKTEDQ